MSQQPPFRQHPIMVCYAYMYLHLLFVSLLKITKGATPRTTRWSWPYSSSRPKALLCVIRIIISRCDGEGSNYLCLTYVYIRCHRSCQEKLNIKFFCSYFELLISIVRHVDTKQQIARLPSRIAFFRLRSFSLNETPT